MFSSNQAKLEVLKQHLTNDYIFFPKNPISYLPDGSDGPSIKFMREGPEMKDEYHRKSVIIDFDGVVNRPGTPAPFELYLDKITDTATLSGKRNEILKNIKMLEEGEDVHVYSDRISQILRDGKFNYDDHREAAKYAAKNVSMSSNLGNAVERLNNMGYDVCILSASPESLVENFVRYRMPGKIKSKNVIGSKFNFENNDYRTFHDMRLNLGDLRSENRDSLMQSSVKTQNGIEIMVNDNPKTGRKIVKYGWNHVYFWLNKTDPIPDSVSVEILDLRRDFNKIVDSVKKIERGVSVTIMMDEDRYRNCIEMANDVLSSAEKIEWSSGRSLNLEKDNFTRKLRKYERSMMGLFQADRINLNSRVVEVELEKNQKIVKSKVKSITEDFKNNSLESKLKTALY